MILAAESLAALGAMHSGLVIQVPAAALQKPMTVGIQRAAGQALPGVERRLEAKLPPTLDSAMGPVLRSFSVHVDGITVPLPVVVQKALAAKMNALVKRTITQYAQQNLRPTEIITPALTKTLWNALVANLHEVQVAVPFTVPVLGRLIVPVVLELQQARH